MIYKYSFDRCRYPSEVQRIVKLLASEGYFLNAREAEELWEDYSESYFAASWLSLPEQDTVLLDILIRIIEREDWNETDD